MRHEKCKRCDGPLVDRIAPKNGKRLRYCPICHGKAKRLAKSVRPDVARAQTRAHSAVAKALRLGQLKRQPCEEAHCADPKTEAHHPDYARPLDVRWLCRTHHRRRHIALNNATKSRIGK